MFREPEGKKVVETVILSDALTDADKVNIDVQKRSGAKDTYGTFSSVNPPIAKAATTPLSYHMDKISVLPTKTPSFASSNI